MKSKQTVTKENEMKEPSEDSSEAKTSSDVEEFHPSSLIPHPSESVITDSSDARSGFVAFIGRPNAGKSTLLNHLVGEKIAAVSNKPQTTRTRIQGIITDPRGQIVFVDTPGVHKPGYRLNKRMMQAVLDAVESVDVLILMRDASVSTGNGDRFVLDLIKQAGKKTFLVLNKIDRVRKKDDLLSLINDYRAEYDFAEYFPISALNGENTDALTAKIFDYLPVGPPLFDEDALTDQTERTLVAEFIREKLLRDLKAELPFVVAVAVEKWEPLPNGVLNLACVILVERQSQRAIVIGKGGERLKVMATSARADIEQMLDQRVFLELFVKVEPHWRDNERVLDMLGLERYERQ
jgi:GTPase